MDHRQSASGTGRTSVSDIISALKGKGVQAQHRVTRLRPEIIEDPEGVAEFMANHNPPPFAAALRPEQIEAQARKSAFDASLLEEEEHVGFTEEELFRIRRRAARERLREREDL